MQISVHTTTQSIIRLYNLHIVQCYPYILPIPLHGWGGWVHGLRAIRRGRMNLLLSHLLRRTSRALQPRLQGRGSRERITSHTPLFWQWRWRTRQLCPDLLWGLCHGEGGMRGWGRQRRYWVRRVGVRVCPVLRVWCLAVLRKLLLLGWDRQRGRRVWMIHRWLYLMRRRALDH